MEMALLASMFNSGLEVVTTLRSIMPQPSHLQALVGRGAASKNVSKDVAPAAAEVSAATTGAQVAVADVHIAKD